jgi:hypothetical protein
MREMLIAAIFLVLGAVPAHALSTATAFATIDWTGFTFTSTGSLSVTVIQSFPPQESGGPVLVTPTTVFGTANASGSAVNGLLTAAASATTFQPGAGSGNFGVGDASALDQFILMGTGTGNIVVSVPYHIAVFVDVTDPTHDLAFAIASVSLSEFHMGPTFAVARLDNVTGSVTRDGVLTLATPFPTTAGVPGLIGFSIDAHVIAGSALPEAPTMVLTAFGLIPAVLLFGSRHYSPSSHDS